MSNLKKDWVDLVQMGRLDEAYRIYLSSNPSFKFSKLLPLRILSVFLSCILVLLIKSKKLKIITEDSAVDLSREFLIFWKCPNIIGRFLLAKIVFFYLQNQKLPARTLTWLAHWLVFQGNYRQAVILFKSVLRIAPIESRLHGEVLSLVANYFHSRKKLILALKFHSKADAILLKNNDKFFQMFNLGTSSKSYSELGQLKPFNENVLARYDHLNPTEPDERYGMRVLIYGAYLHLISGNIDLGKQFYLSAEKSFKKSGSPLDKSIYCIYKSVILFFFRDLTGARKAIGEAEQLLEEYGVYLSYRELIETIKDYFSTGSSTHPILENMFFKETYANRSELESWYGQFFNLILPVMENFETGDFDSIVISLEKATSSNVVWKVVKDEILFEDMQEVKFFIKEDIGGGAEFELDLFHANKIINLNLSTSFKKWRNPEIFETIRSTLILLQNLSRQEHFRKLTYIQSQKLKEGEIARRIAHDIKSPLATLQIALNDIRSNSDNYDLIKNSTQRIEDIVSSLSTKWDYKRTNKKEKILVGQILESIVFNKKYEYQGKNIELKLHFSGNTKAQYILTNELEMARTFSNIINNAKESYVAGGEINIFANVDGGNLVVDVKDFGCGVEAKNLNRIFEKDVSFKKNGSGLGLYYAKMFLEENYGSISAKSRINVGSSIKISYPLCSPPTWIKTTLFLNNYKRVVIVDDFYSNVEMIEKKIRSSCPSIEILSFFTANEFRSFIERENIENTFFIFDYDLMDQRYTGIDLINDYGLGDSSVLATHYYESVDVIQACKSLGIKIVPKNVFDFVRVIGESVNVFIADDEKYFLKVASKALINNFNVYTFDNADEMLRKAASVEGNNFFFVDRNLGENKADEAYSFLRSRGLKDIFNISEDSDFFHGDAIKMRKNEIIDFLT